MSECLDSNGGSIGDKWKGWMDEQEIDESIGWMKTDKSVADW